MQEQSFVLDSRDTAMNVVRFMDRIIAGSELYEAIIKPFKKQRSVQQNRLYWLWMGDLSNYTGHTKDELHEYFRHRFLQVKVSMIFGEESQTRQSTTSLKVGEFTEYLQSIEDYMRRKGYELPHPHVIYDYAINGEKPN